MTQGSAKWFAVMIEGEEFPELVGPYRSEDRADEIAEKWNREHTSEDGKAWVMPLLPSLCDVS